MSSAKASGLWIAAAIFLLALPVSPACAARKINVGMVGKNQAYLPVWVGEKEGFFQNKGIEVSNVIVRALDIEAQALLSGSVQFSTSAAETVIRLDEKGEDMKIIASLNNVPGFSMVGQKGLKSIKDLKGTTLGVSGIKSGTTVLMQDLLRANGLKFPRDYKMIQVGSTRDRLAALQAGNVAGVMLMIPMNYLAVDQGFPELGVLSDYVKGYQFTDINVAEKWSRANHAVTVDFLEGILRANRWIHAHRKEAVAIAAKETGVPLRYADQAYDYYITRKIQPLDGSVPEAGVKKVIDSLGALGDLQKPYPPASEFIDMSYLREAQRRVFGR